MEDSGIAFDTLPAPPRSDGSPLQPVTLPGGRGWVGLDIRVRDEAAGVTIAVTFDSTRYEPDGVGSLLGDLQRVAVNMATNLDSRVAGCARLVSAGTSQAAGGGRCDRTAEYNPVPLRSMTP
jgi:hypothetical protein